MNNWKKRATEAAETVYRELLEQIVAAHVLNDRADSRVEHGRELSEKERKAVAESKQKDPRPVRLMTISGKGGWVEDAEKCARYLCNTNITLLDHLLSVARGSLMLAALDWLARNPDMEKEFLYRKLRLIAVLAFMHDIDKDLNLGGRIQSVEDVNDDQVAERMRRYGIEDFLEKNGISLTPGQLLYLIDKVEAQQSNRRLPEQLPEAYADGALPLYVRLADKLDGIFLDGDPARKKDEKGMDGVIKRLSEDRSCLRSEELRRLFTAGRVVDIYDPHHPFLLDELQQQLALSSRNLVGAPPLLETHHDGRLLVLLYEEQAEAVIEQAIETVCAALPFSLKINVNPRGEPELLNGQPSHTELTNFLANIIQHNEIKNLFLIKADDVDSVFDPLAECMEDLGLSPKLPATYNKNVSLYDSAENIQGNAKTGLRRAAHAILLLNLNLKNTPKNFPDYEAREQAFLKLLPEAPPDWICQMKYGHGRRVLTALWAVTLAAEDGEIKQAIWGNDGLLQQWLEGTAEIPAFRQFIQADGEQVSQAVKVYFQQRTSGVVVSVADENAQEYCHFTAQPVPAGLVVKDNLGLGKIGIRASAFNGRDNRPEGLGDGSHTPVSPVSLAEYSKRAQIYEAAQGNREIAMPTLLSSPTTLGLFGGLALDSDRSIRTVALRDLTSIELGRLDDLAQYKGRCRIARFESFADNTEGQIKQLYWLLQGMSRLGRPMHIFRGLPVQSRAFFHFDALPEWLGELLQEREDREHARELRLEQIPRAIERLKIADILLRVPGLGYDVFRLYANKKTRFSSLCRSWCYLWDKKDVKFKEINQTQVLDTRRYLETEFQCYMLEENQMNWMSKSDTAVLEFARQATRIQSNRGASATMRKQLQVLDLCLEFMSGQRKHGRLKMDSEEERKALKLGIGGWLEDNLTRRKDYAAKSYWQAETYEDACLDVARYFVETVWPDTFEGRIPSLERLRNIKSIYRMAFIQCYQPKSKKEEGKQDTEIEETIKIDLL